jgi:hypothetical protein
MALVKVARSSWPASRPLAIGPLQAALVVTGLLACYAERSSAGGATLEARQTPQVLKLVFEQQSQVAKVQWPASRPGGPCGRRSRPCL